MSGFNAFKGFAFLLLFAPLVFSSSQVSITPQGLSACSCDPVYYDVRVYSDDDDVFEMQFESTGGFSHYLSPQLPVPAGSSIKTTLVLNTACNAQPGNYSFNIIARGGLSASRAEGFVIVRSCRNLQVSLPPQQSVCSGSFQSVLVSVKNDGLVNERGRLAFENIPPAFYSIASDSFDLNPGETRNFMLSIQPPEGTPPSSFSYTVRANNAYAIAGLEITSCNFNQPEAITLTPLSDKIEFCAGSKKSVGVSLKNEGETAFFDLTSSGVPGNFISNRVSVSKGVSRTIDFSINAEQLPPGNHTLTLNAFGPYSSGSASVSVVLKDCFNAVFGDLELCLGDGGSIPFSFKNNNPAIRQYDFTTNSEIPSRVEPASAVLVAGDAVSASLLVTGSALGAFPVFVYANQSIFKTTRVIVKACTESQSLSIVSRNSFNAEAGVEQEFAIEFNKPLSQGLVTLPQSLFSISSVSVSGSRILFKAIPLFQDSRTVQASIQANGLLFEESLSFSLRPASVEVREKSQTTLSRDGLLQNQLLLSVSNNGVSKVVLAPSIEGLEASFEPPTLELNPGEEKELKAVFSATENSTVALKLSSQDSKTYGLTTTAVNAPSSTTGFFTATRAVGLFAIIIVLAIIALAFVLKREFSGEQEKGEVNGNNSEASSSSKNGSKKK